jgi:hypothetical protein
MVISSRCFSASRPRLTSPKPLYRFEQKKEKSDWPHSNRGGVSTLSQTKKSESTGQPFLNFFGTGKARKSPSEFYSSRVTRKDLR